MSRRGNCWDNAVIESFFKTLKTETIYQHLKLISVKEMKQVIAEYMGALQPYSTTQYEWVFITSEIRTKKNGAFSSNGKKSRYQKVLTLQSCHQA